MSLAANPSRSGRSVRAIARPGARDVYGLLSVGMASVIVVAFVAGVTEWTPAAYIALPLVGLTGAWIAGGAATAIIGLTSPAPVGDDAPVGWVPAGSTAVLVTLCGEEPRQVARYLSDLRKALDRAGLDDAVRLIVLSDTSGDGRVPLEEDVFSAMKSSGTVDYRRRRENSRRKPGNIAEWLRREGGRHEYMMVLDADSRMTAGRIRRMIWQMERRPQMGLLQAGISLVPARTRLGRHQRVASRLLSRNFGRGFAAWTGDSGNYWGHNAIMRIRAFRPAADLPVLRGSAPFGGDILSHDFIEAAFIRRAGWSVGLDPDPSGSAEDAPQTFGEFHRRDRRWCQGNLQHLRLLCEPGLDPVSRFHLFSGVLSYLVAPAWIALVALFAVGAVAVSGPAAIAAVAAVLVLPKLCGLADRLLRSRTARRRRISVKAWAGEVIVSSIIAPLFMVRQAIAVGSVCLGRDCGWQPAGSKGRSLPVGLAESGVGVCLALGSLAAGGGTLAWLAPVVLPLIAAPVIVRALDAPA